jgi:hypothetical protein
MITTIPELKETIPFHTMSAKDIFQFWELEAN